MLQWWVLAQWWGWGGWWWAFWIFIFVIFVLLVGWGGTSVYRGRRGADDEDMLVSGPPPASLRPPLTPEEIVRERYAKGEIDEDAYKRQLQNLRLEARPTATEKQDAGGGKGPIGKTRWAIAEGYIPGWSHGPEPELTSHESACILNASDSDAHVGITIYFREREPLGPFRITVPARRCHHLRFNDLDGPGKIPLATEYASVIESDAPIVVQHTRLDSRQADNALITTIAYSEP